MHQYKLTLYRWNGDGDWVCDLSQSRDSHKTLEIFGTLIMPTSYRATAPADLVAWEMGKLNPDHEIVVIAPQARRPQGRARRRSDAYEAHKRPLEIWRPCEQRQNHS